jgi:hypothetical protein
MIVGVGVGVGVGAMIVGRGGGRGVRVIEVAGARGVGVGLGLGRGREVGIEGGIRATAEDKRPPDCRHMYLSHRRKARFHKTCQCSNLISLLLTEDRRTPDTQLSSEGRRLLGYYTGGKLTRSNCRWRHRSLHSQCSRHQRLPRRLVDCCLVVLRLYTEVLPGSSRYKSILATQHTQITKSRPWLLPCQIYSPCRGNCEI